MATNRRTWVAFVVLSATFFMLLVDFSIVSIALPTIETELRMSAVQGQWIVSTYAIILAGFLMLTGRCADLYGRFRFFIAGLILFTAGSLLGGIAHDGTLLIAMRGVQGLGAAMVNPAALALVLSMFPPGPERSRAIALWGTIGSTGIAAGMLFGGVLVQYLGWRSVFFVNVPFAIAILAMLPWFVPRDTPQRAKVRLDVAGAVTLTLALLTFVYTIEAIPGRGFVSVPTGAGVFITVVLLGVLVRIERTALEPILPKRLFRYPDLLSGAIVIMLQPMSYAGVLVFASMYAQRVSGYSALDTGLAFLPSSFAISFIASPLTMPIVRRIGVRTMGFAAAAMMTAGEAILLFVHPATPYWLGLLPATVIGGFGGMLAYQSGMIAGLAHVEEVDEGSASATLSFALQLGIGFGVALGASAQQLRTQALVHAGVPAAPAFAAGLQAAFWVCVVVGIANVISVAGIRHAAKAELPVRRYLPFGKIQHRVAAHTP